MHIIWSNVSNTSPTTAPLIIDHSKRMTWRDYLTENSVEQEIRGSEMERRRITETIKKMEVGNKHQRHKAHTAMRQQTWSMRMVGIVSRMHIQSSLYGG
eukprot:scaffold210996_cov63-Cyclotella_meneghiniana.AAC.7